MTRDSQRHELTAVELARGRLRECRCYAPSHGAVASRSAVDTGLRLFTYRSLHGTPTMNLTALIKQNDLNY